VFDSLYELVAAGEETRIVLERAKHPTTAKNSLTNSKKWATAKCGEQAQPFGLAPKQKKPE